MAVVVQENAAPVVAQRGRDSYRSVRSVMEQVLEGRGEEGLLRSILADLKELVERAERVRQLAPELAGVEVSEFIYKMLKMADQRQVQ
jgi:hypothetical protein